MYRRSPARPQHAGHAPDEGGDPARRSGATSTRRTSGRRAWSSRSWARSPLRKPWREWRRRSATGRAIARRAPMLAPVPGLDGIRERRMCRCPTRASRTSSWAGPRCGSIPTSTPARLANTVLGVFGMMGRLGDNVRERQGMAYYAYSQLAASRQNGMWLAVAGVNPANVDRAIERDARRDEAAGRRAGARRRAGGLQALSDRLPAAATRNQRRRRQPPGRYRVASVSGWTTWSATPASSTA